MTYAGERFSAPIIWDHLLWSLFHLGNCLSYVKTCRTDAHAFDICIKDTVLWLLLRLPTLCLITVDRHRLISCLCSTGQSSALCATMAEDSPPAFLHVYSEVIICTQNAVGIFLGGFCVCVCVCVCVYAYVCVYMHFSFISPEFWHKFWCPLDFSSISLLSIVLKSLFGDPDLTFLRIDSFPRSSLVIYGNGHITISSS
jgi:hypothetical protein